MLRTVTVPSKRKVRYLLHIAADGSNEELHLPCVSLRHVRQELERLDRPVVSTHRLRLVVHSLKRGALEVTLTPTITLSLAS